MFSFPGFRQDRRGTLDAELDELRREIGRLAGRASRLSAAAYQDGRERASGIHDDVSDAVASWLPVARREVARAERAARDNPATTAALVGIVVLGLVASLVYTRT